MTKRSVNPVVRSCPSGPPLSPGLKLKLAGEGLQFPADLLHVDPPQLSREASLHQQEALEAVRREGGGGGGAGAAAVESLTALELLQKEDEELRSIVTLQLAVDVQVPQCFGGVGGQVVYIDTEGGFLLQRVVDIAAAAVRHCSLLVEDDEQRVAIDTFTVETVLSNMFLVRCHDYVELLAELHLLSDFLSNHPRVRLLVIDSVACPFRKHFDELSQRTRLLNGLALQLIAMATSHEIAVVITNQMTTRVHGSQSQLVPALGDSWGHAPTTRLLLQWMGPHRLAAIFKSPDHMNSTVQYQITSDGFRDADQSEQPQRKRPRTDTDQSAGHQRDTSC
ncbi:DNA repair protein RAD51-like protein 3 [Larimichthys crocea]|nr:DNA repair protein RAD51-like protein 3 [Larimichthys crocea]